MLLTVQQATHACNRAGIDSVAGKAVTEEQTSKYSSSVGVACLLSGMPHGADMRLAHLINLPVQPPDTLLVLVYLIG